MVFDDFSGSDLTQRKMVVRGLIYRLLILTIELYNFGMFKTFT